MRKDKILEEETFDYKIDKKEYKVGDRIFIRERNLRGTIIQIKNGNGLIRWDKQKDMWGLKTIPDSWVNLETEKLMKPLTVLRRIIEAWY